MYPSVQSVHLIEPYFRGIERIDELRMLGHLSLGQVRINLGRPCERLIAVGIEQQQIAHDGHPGHLNQTAGHEITASGPPLWQLPCRHMMRTKQSNLSHNHLANLSGHPFDVEAGAK